MADLIPGSGTISKIYAGSSEVQKIYAGLDLVYPTGTPATDDWDTYEDGIIAIPIIGGTASGDLIEISGLSSVDPAIGGYNASNWPATRFGGVTQTNYTEAWPWIAVWSVTDQAWLGYSQRSGTGYSYDRVDYRDNASSPNYLSGTTYPSDHLVFVGLTSQPQNFANWRDYDGEVSAWESTSGAIQLWSSNNSWWAVNGTGTWSRSGDAFGAVQWIAHNGTNLTMRINKGSRFADMQDYIDEYEYPTFWVYINGVKYEFVGYDVTFSGDLLLVGPAVPAADFIDNGSGSNNLGWTVGSTVFLEFRPTWETFYPRVGLLGGDASAAVGRVSVYYEAGTAPFQQISAGGTEGLLYPTEFIRSGADLIELNTSNGSWNATDFAAEAPYAAWWRGGTIGWDKGPNITTGIFKVGIRYQATYGILDFNSFATNPVGFILYTRDPGLVTKWAAYDGPLYDYDTYQVQNFWDPSHDTNRTDAYRIPITQAVTGNDYIPASLSADLSGFSAPLYYSPAVGYFSDRTAGHALLEEHCTVHYWSSSVGSGAYSSAGGWYAFGLIPTPPSGGGVIPYSELEFSCDPDSGFRGGLGKFNTIQTSSKGGESAKYWTPPFPKDGLIAFLPFTQMGSTYNYRTDAGSSMLVLGNGYQPDDEADYYFPFYSAVFSGNRILFTFTGVNRSANGIQFFSRVGGSGATCTVRLRDAAALQANLGIGTEYTYTGTWGTWVNDYSYLLTLSNPSAGAPFNWSTYNDGTTEFLLPFPCAFRIES